MFIRQTVLHMGELSLLNRSARDFLMCFPDQLSTWQRETSTLTYLECDFLSVALGHFRVEPSRLLGQLGEIFRCASEKGALAHLLASGR